MAGAGGSERVRPPRGEALRARWDRLGPPLKAAAAAGSPGPGNSRPTCPIEGCGERDARVLQPGCSAGRDTSGSSEHLGETQGSERALQTPGKEDSSSTKGSQVLPSWARAPCQLLPLIFHTAREKHALSPSVSKQRRATKHFARSRSISTEPRGGSGAGEAPSSSSMEELQGLGAALSPPTSCTQPSPFKPHLGRLQGEHSLQMRTGNASISPCLNGD